MGREHRITTDLFVIEQAVTGLGARPIPRSFGNGRAGMVDEIGSHADETSLAADIAAIQSGKFTGRPSPAQGFGRNFKVHPGSLCQTLVWYKPRVLEMWVTGRAGCRSPRFHSPTRKTSDPLCRPVAFAGWLDGPVFSGVMNFDPIAGIASRNDKSPAGKATVVNGWLIRGVPIRR